MVNLPFVSFASNDQSLLYLAQIFGYMNGIIPNVNNNPNVITPVFVTMFTAFNSVVLTIGTLIVLYTTIVGIMHTAHEGQFMGKNWNNLWIPIRTVLGISALVPTASGYSGIQIIMMWVIIQGIGAADTLWNTVLTTINVTGSPYAQVNIPSVGVSNSMTQLFAGL